MAYPNGGGVFTQGLAADLLGRSPNPIAVGLAGGLLQGLPSVTPAPPTSTDDGEVPSEAQQTPASPLADGRQCGSTGAGTDGGMPGGMQRR